MAARQEVTFVITARDRTRAVFRRMGEQIGRLRKRLNSFGAKLVGVFGAGVIARGVAKTAESIDNIAKAAKRLGVGIGFLSRFAFAAELSGSNLDDLEKGIRNLSKATAEAAVLDTDAAQEGFRLLGLEAKELLELDPATRFLVTATALGKIEDQAIRTAAAQRLFGRAGQQLLPLSDQIAGNLEATAKAAEDAGAAIDDKLGNQAEEFIDQLTVLNAQLDQFYRTLLQISQDNEVLEGLGEILKLLGAIAKATSATGTFFGETAAKGVVGIERAVENLEALGSPAAPRPLDEAGGFIGGRQVGFTDPELIRIMGQVANNTADTARKVGDSGRLD